MLRRIATSMSALFITKFNFFFELGLKIPSFEQSISRASQKMKLILREQRGKLVSSTSVLSLGLKAWSFCWTDPIVRQSALAGIRVCMVSSPGLRKRRCGAKAREVIVTNTCDQSPGVSKSATRSQELLSITERGEVPPRAYEGAS